LAWFDGSGWIIHNVCRGFAVPQAYGYELPKDIEYIYTHVRKTHNTGVFDAYTDEMKRARKSGILTGEQNI
jgi:pyruvate-formate lyase